MSLENPLDNPCMSHEYILTVPCMHRSMLYGLFAMVGKELKGLYGSYTLLHVIIPRNATCNIT